MSPKIYIPFVCVALWVSALAVRAETISDPADAFLTAYSDYQRGEKLAGTGDTANAVKAFKDADRLLGIIIVKFPKWNPSIVEYRRTRTKEALVRLGGGGAAERPTVPEPAPAVENLRPASTEPLLPVNDLELIPLDAAEHPSLPPRTDEPKRTNSSRGTDTTVAGPTGNTLEDLQKYLNKLIDDLKKTHDELDEMREQKAEANRQMDASNAARKTAEDRQSVLKSRADNAENALKEALGKNGSDAAMVKKLLAEKEQSKKELRQAQIDKDAAEEVRQQITARLAASQERTTQLQKERDEATKLSAGAKSQIEAAEKQMLEALKDRDTANSKVTKLTLERDDAQKQLGQLREAQKDVGKLLEENNDLMAKLGEAERKVVTYQTDSKLKDSQISDLRKEVKVVGDQLAEVRALEVAEQGKLSDLETKLESASKQLAVLKPDNSSSSTEKKKLLDENDLLRGIVMRQMKEQARRDQTRKLVMDQMKKMEIKSQELLSQINYMGQPIVKLSEKERGLFKKPQLEISGNEIFLSATKTEPVSAPVADPAGGTALPLAAEPTMSDNQVSGGVAPESDPVLPPSELPAGGSPSVEKLPEPPPSTASQSTDITPSLNNSILTTGNERTGDGSETPGGAKPGSDIPESMHATVDEAKKAFELGHYREAEQLYEKVLQEAPSNVYALSNLGVVRFRSGKLKSAEDAFKKALAITPDDGFSRCTLGIVYYSQSKFDEAVNELTKALAIDPKNAIAHNYLGITASQKGWSAAAQKELETATKLDPNYADAQFNLAVVYATQQPPNKEAAKRFYHRAVELGAEPDAQLETLLK